MTQPSEITVNCIDRESRPLAPHACRVALFTDTLADVNGVSRFITDMGNQAARAGRDLTIITSTDLPLEPRDRTINLRPRLACALPGYSFLRLVSPPMLRAARLLAQIRPTAVHISTPGPVGLAGLLAARRADLPLLATYHTDFPAYVAHLFDDPSLEWLALEAMRAFYAPVSRVFTRSADYARRLRLLGIHCSRIKRLRPGTDTDAFHPRHRDPSIWERLDPGAQPGTLRVLAVGRLSLEKNWPLLSRAWLAAQSRLNSAGTSARLIVVGDGPYRQRMQSDLSSAGAAATFLGFRYAPELSAIYASCDLFAFPSATDTLGQVAMEAQASGLPVLVTDQGGPREMVRDGRTGLVLSAHDAAAWADALVQLTLDAPQRARMGAAARSHMESHSIAASFEHWWAEHARLV